MKRFIIIGGGILGASTAYHLAKQGAEVILIDRKDKGQATDASAGIICPWLTQRRNKAWYQLAKAGARYYPYLINELEKAGEDNTGYKRVGALSIHKDLEKIKKAGERVSLRRGDAPEIEDVTELSPEEANRLFPVLDIDYHALHISGAARVDGRLLRDSLLSAAEKLGASIINGDAVLQFSGSRVTGVKTGDKEFQAYQVIVCAGAWANSLLKPLGVDLQVTFQKAQIVHLEIQDGNTNEWPVIMPPTNQYLLAFDKQRIVAGATHEDLENLDDRITAGGVAEVLNKALNVAPGLNNSTFIEARVGYRPFTPGFLPVIGPLPGWKGILAANGLGASGLTMGPYLGSELAKLALGLELELDLTLYNIEGAIKS